MTCLKRPCRHSILVNISMIIADEVWFIMQMLETTEHHLFICSNKAWFIYSLSSCRCEENATWEVVQDSNSQRLWGSRGNTSSCWRFVPKYTFAAFAEMWHPFVEDNKLNDLKTLPIHLVINLCLICILDKKAAKNLQELTSRFYTLIPHDFGRQRPPIINTLENVREKMDMLMVRKCYHQISTSERIQDFP